MNNVYLLPHDDGTYGACIAPTAPSENALLLTAEGEYPVDYVYCRLDANGSSVYEGCHCENQEELMRCLAWDGKACHIIRSLWDFVSVEAEYHDAWGIFNAATDRVMALIDESWSVLESEEDCTRNGMPLGCPTVKELIAVLSDLPEDYRVTCCGAECFMHLFEQDKSISLDNEKWLS